MRKMNLFAIVTCGAMAVALAAPTSAAAKTKKLTYDQAWAKCQSKIGQAIPGDQVAQRHAWGSACMKKYGYKI